MRLGHISQRRARPEAVDGPYHGHAFLPIGVEDVLDDKVAPA